MAFSKLFSPANQAGKASAAMKKWKEERQIAKHAENDARIMLDPNHPGWDTFFNKKKDTASSAQGEAERDVNTVGSVEEDDAPPTLNPLEPPVDLRRYSEGSRQVLDISPIITSPLRGSSWPLSLNDTRPASGDPRESGSVTAGSGHPLNFSNFNLDWSPLLPESLNSVDDSTRRSGSPSKFSDSSSRHSLMRPDARSGGLKRHSNFRLPRFRRSGPAEQPAVDGERIELVDGKDRQPKVDRSMTVRSQSAVVLGGASDERPSPTESGVYQGFVNRDLESVGGFSLATHEEEDLDVYLPSTRCSLGYPGGRRSSSIRK
ncbi:hypothetical protein QFC24_004481 [Naganishia onofrii]|uniref:Uncharacterized protein n=1 Tax=Naganishia onofrii TaxID=1851511 RepID=A0ACC2XCV9_9TREE|nr:hypothetical protein QFC24_004481 [Naganishia onofrii]